MNKEQVRDIITSKKRTYIDEQSYKKCQREIIDDMLRQYKASDTLITGLIKMFEDMDKLGHKIITLGEFINMLKDIDYERNEKQIRRLNKNHTQGH